MKCVCICCGEPVMERGMICGDCLDEGFERPDSMAYFTTRIEAIAYGEQRRDWPRFGVRHLHDGLYVVYNIYGGL